MRAITRRRRVLPRLLVAMALLGGMAGCVAPGLQRGFSGRDAELARARGSGDFSVVSATPERAVVSALGKQVAVEPAAGFCLTREAIETSSRSAFLLLGDCALEEPAGGGAGAEGALDLPRGVPGIITVSISGDPGFAQTGRPNDISGLQSFVDSAEGRALLGRGGESDQVSVVETRHIGNCLYVLVEDGDSSVPVLAPRFWRAFVELNGRLTVVTISGFRDRPLPEEEMLRHLGDQVRQLQVANSEPADEAPVQYAAAPVEPRTPQPRTPQSRTAAWPSIVPRTEQDAIEEEVEGRAPKIADIEPTSIIVASDSGDEGFWPVPARRRVTGPARQPARPTAAKKADLAVATPPRRPREPAAQTRASAPAKAPAARPRP